MKALLIALISLVPFTASAATELRCKDVNAGPDHGYSAVVKRLSSAVVTEQSIAGPRLVANMRCTLPHSINRPDRPHLVAMCSTVIENGRYYLLAVRNEGNGTHTAALSENDGRVFRNLAKLSCRAF